MRHLFVVLALFLSGCGVISTNPVYTAKDVLYDDALVGTWQTRDELFFGRIEVSRWAPADDSYRIVVMDQNDKKQLGVVRAYLFKMDDQRYLSLEVEEPLPSGTPPTKRISYTTLAYDQSDGKVKLRALTSGWLYSKLLGDPAAIKHETVRGDKPDETFRYYRLTATTEELRAFYQSQLSDRDAWCPFEFTKKP